MCPRNRNKGDVIPIFARDFIVNQNILDFPAPDGKLYIVSGAPRPQDKRRHLGEVGIDRLPPFHPVPIIRCHMRQTPDIKRHALKVHYSIFVA